MGVLIFTRRTKPKALQLPRRCLGKFSVELDLMRPLRIPQAPTDECLQFSCQGRGWLKTLAYYNTSHCAGKLQLIWTRHYGRLLHRDMLQQRVLDFNGTHP